jgi:hypothetical protein
MAAGWYVFTIVFPWVGGNSFYAGEVIKTAMALLQLLVVQSTVFVAAPGLPVLKNLSRFSLLLMHSGCRTLGALFVG